MSDILKIFGKRMRTLRRVKDMTQEQLAERAGLSLQSIGEIERGRGNPTLVNVDRLALALEVGLSELFDIGDIGLTKEQAMLELSLLLGRAADEQLRAVLTIARFLIQK